MTGRPIFATLFYFVAAIAFGIAAVETKWLIFYMICFLNIGAGIMMLWMLDWMGKDYEQVEEKNKLTVRRH